MKTTRLPVRRRHLAVAASLAALAGPASIFAVPAPANAAPALGGSHGRLTPGDLLVTTG